MGHLGTRVSALLDGQLDAVEEERSWAHVHECHQCRDLVEREGWVKTRLAGLGAGDPVVPASLKGTLLGGAPDRVGSPAPAWTSWAVPPGEAFLELAAHRPRRSIGLAAIGGGAVGAAMMGVLALGAAPASAPTIDRRVPPAPAASVSPPSPVASIGTQGGAGALRRDR